MQESELIALWRSYDQKLEENLILNRQNAAAITLIKIKSLMNSMAPLKIFTIIAGMLWITFLTVVLYHTYSFASLFFWVSIFIHVVLLTVVIGIYIYQLVLIFQTDISEALFKTQHRLASLTSSTLLVFRLMFLHAPIWTIFCISEKMFNHPVWLILQVAITLVFFIGALWLFFNIKYENRDKKWFRLIFSGKEWTPVIKSMELLREIEGYGAAR
jgi:glucan phosphoethanolaminetransferase (alkaline phosphatase superfamily)